MADVILACAACGDPIPPRGARKFCCQACKVRAGKPRPCQCLNCGVRFSAVKWISRVGKPPRMVAYNGAKTCSTHCRFEWMRRDPERKRKIGAAFKGPKHPNWQGGKSLLNNVANRGPNWPAQRRAALKRDGWTCVDCGLSNEHCKQAYGRGLDVDHVVPFHNFQSYKAANSLRNLASRCASCHRIAESKRGMVQMVLPMQDSMKRRHKPRVRGEQINTAKLTEENVRHMRQRTADGATHRSLSIEYGVSYNAVAQAVTGKTWRHLPMPETLRLTTKV